jgi:DNA-binding response OmpR family regulator
MKNTLLVDDEPGICLRLGCMQWRSRVECVHAHSAEEDGLAPTKRQFDMVLLYVPLPGGLGCDPAPSIVVGKPAARSEVIRTMPLEDRDTLVAAADLFNAKPFQRAMILSSTRDLGFQV